MLEKDRYWTFLVYPESAPVNWKEILQQTGLPIAISPLHDKDENPDGSIKKPHYHILLCFSGPTTFRKVNNSICCALNSPIPKRVLSIIGIYRYFTHMDNPEKYQYNSEDICSINGFDIKDYDTLTTSQVLAIKKSLITIILNNGILSYRQLLNFLLQEKMMDHFNVATTHVMFLSQYFKFNVANNQK